MNPKPAPMVLPLAIAADLQDHLLITNCDLARLQALLDDSHQSLQGGFFGALALLQQLAGGDRLDTAVLDAARVHLHGAVKALQFQDLATQLIGHTTRRLQHCADRLACDALAGDDDDGCDAAAIAEPPPRPNPVTQSAMQTGFIELV